jgi:hypothetical protein
VRQAKNLAIQSVRRAMPTETLMSVALSGALSKRCAMAGTSIPNPGFNLQYSIREAP